MTQPQPASVPIAIPTSVSSRELPCDFCDDRPAAIITREPGTNAYGQPVTYTERYCVPDYERWG